MDPTLPTENTQYTDQSSKKKLWIIIVLVLIVVGIAALVFVTYVSKQKNSTNNTDTTRTYQDDGGYFSVEIPKTWDTSENIAKGTTGIGTPYEKTQNIEEIQLSYQDQTGVDIQIYQGKPSCPLNMSLSTNIAGLPASYDPTYNTWTIPTNKAWVTVTASYPGSGITHDNAQYSQSLPSSSVIEQDKQAVMNVMKTLKFNDFSSYSC